MQGYTTLTLGGTTFSLVYQGHERIFMLLTTGDLITRQISSCNGTAATIVSPWDRAIAPHYVAMFGKLILCRFDQDELEMQYDTTEVSHCKLAFKELAKEYTVQAVAGSGGGGGFY